MAKAAKTAIKKDGKGNPDAKNFTKVIKTVRSPKTGAYTFKEGIVHKDKIKDFMSEKQYKQVTQPFFYKSLVFTMIFATLHEWLFS